MRNPPPCLAAILALMIGIFTMPVIAEEGLDKATAHREVPDDAPGSGAEAATSGAQRVELPAIGTPFAPVQVNVDSFGANIPGDAGNETSIAVDPTAPNRMAIGWRQFDTVSSNFRQAGWAYTKDGGRTWTFPGVIEPGVFRSDPVLDFDSEGNFYYNSLSYDSDFFCDVFKSSDGGETWEAGVYAHGGDKQWMVIDRTEGIGRGNIYADWTRAFSGCDGEFTRSYDGGASYLDCIDVPGQPQWGTMSVGPDGEVYIVGNGILARSDTLQDQDVSPEFQLLSYFDLGAGLQAYGGPNPGGLMGQMWVATDHSGGETYGNVYLLASVGPFGSDPLDVRFLRSTNHGATWSAPVRVNDDGPKVNAWQWFGTMSVAPNGRIDAVWNDTRDDESDDFLSRLYYSQSWDAGVTWSENVALTPAFEPHLGWPQQNKMGDYIEMISDKVGAHVAFAATFNGEQDVYYLRIGDYDCNDNGVGDSEDIATGASFDCNDNDIPDECEIAVDPGLDTDGDGLLDECESMGDLNGDGVVDTVDLLALLAEWGPCPPEGSCPADLDGSGVVDVTDLLLLLAYWG